MKFIDLVYMAEANKSIASAVCAGVAAVVLLPCFLIAVAVSGHSSKASAAPVPGTYRAEPSVATVAARTANAKRIADEAFARSTAKSVWPLHGVVTTQFGAPDYPYQSIHTGIDIASQQPSGTARITAFKSGHVFIPTHLVGGYGTIVAIDHGNGLTSYYGHLSAILVSPGQAVYAGDVIGIEGSTGNSTGTHLHFEVRQNDSPINPRTYLVGNP